MIWKATYEVYRVNYERTRVQKVVLRGVFLELLNYHNNLKRRKQGMWRECVKERKAKGEGGEREGVRGNEGDEGKRGEWERARE